MIAATQEIYILLYSLGAKKYHFLFTDASHINN